MNCISCPVVRKIFLCSEFPVIPEKWWRKEEEERQLRRVSLSSKRSNDCERKSDTAGSKNLLEIKHASSSADFQDTRNQMNTLHEIRIKNANRLIIGHLNINSTK